MHFLMGMTSQPSLGSNEGTQIPTVDLPHCHRYVSKVHDSDSRRGLAVALTQQRHETAVALGCCLCSPYPKACAVLLGQHIANKCGIPCSHQCMRHEEASNPGRRVILQILLGNEVLLWYWSWYSFGVIYVLYVAVSLYFCKAIV